MSINLITYKKFNNLYAKTIRLPKVILSKGNTDEWDNYGVRDPAVLYNQINGEDDLIVYYTGGNIPKGIKQETGLFFYNDLLKKTIKHNNPILKTTHNQWDSLVASTPWCIKINNKYHLYYRGLTKHFKDDCIGLAISEDCINFKKFDKNPILKFSDFEDINFCKNKLMGVINVVKTFNKEYILTFEGTSKINEEQLQIFGAISKDGYNYKPLNNGYPIFSKNNVKSWNVDRVANPRIVRIESSKSYLLCFNGTEKTGMYALGLASTKNFVDWTEIGGNPFLLPYGKPTNNPFSGRIEGGVFNKENILFDNEYDLFFMSIPANAYSHENGVIGKTKVLLNSNCKTHLFIHNDYCNKSVFFEDDRIKIENNNSFPIALHLQLSKISLIQKFESIIFHIDKNENTHFQICINPDIMGWTKNRGINIIFKNNSIYLVKRFIPDNFNNKYLRYINKKFYKKFQYEKKICDLNKNEKIEIEFNFMHSFIHFLNINKKIKFNTFDLNNCLSLITYKGSLIIKEYFLK